MFYQSAKKHHQRFLEISVLVFLAVIATPNTSGAYETQSKQITLDNLNRNISYIKSQIHELEKETPELCKTFAIPNNDQSDNSGQLVADVDLSKLIDQLNHSSREIASTISENHTIEEVGQDNIELATLAQTYEDAMSAIKVHYNLLLQTNHSTDKLFRQKILASYQLSLLRISIEGMSSLNDVVQNLNLNRQKIDPLKKYLLYSIFSFTSEAISSAHAVTNMAQSEVDTMQSTDETAVLILDMSQLLNSITIEFNRLTSALRGDYRLQSN